MISITNKGKGRLPPKRSGAIISSPVKKKLARCFSFNACIEKTKGKGLAIVDCRIRLLLRFL